MHKKELLTAGKQLAGADKALVMIHGRGANAEDILGLAGYLQVDEFALVAPQATNHTWYPYSFLSPPSSNEPWLSSALQLIRSIVDDVKAAGIAEKKIFFLGFSQGACLALDFAARNATRYGGIIAFTGGLIGDSINTANYKGDFSNTPVFIGTSDPDPHVPAERVNESAVILEKMGALVIKKVYKNMGHTINQDEMDEAGKILMS